MKRLRRFTFLVSYLSANPEADLFELCRILGVSEHVLASDLERLSLCGVYPSTDFRLFDVAVDSGQGRVLFRKNPVPSLSRPVKLSRREVVALLLGFKILRDGIAPPFDWAADQVIREVLRAAGRDARAAVQELESRVSMGSRQELSWDTFYELSRAVCERRRVRLTYYTRSRDDIGERTVRPYVLACSVGRWYVVGHCEWRDEVRTFRLDRIRTATGLEDGFTPPESFDPSAHLGSGIYPTIGSDGQHRVVIGLEPSFALQQGFVVDAPVDGDGQCEVAFDVPVQRYEGFLSWLVSLTTRFEIVSPPALVERFEQRRGRILGGYESVLD